MSDPKHEQLLSEAERESIHFNDEYAASDKEQLLQGYIVPEKFILQATNPMHPLVDCYEYAYCLMGNLNGKLVLDYGAGDGWNAICMAKADAIVWAIDISEKGIDLTKKKAKANGVDGLVKAEVRNCYKTEFQSQIFNAILGGGILHHLDLEAAGRELSRLLRPDGVAVFREPIRETRIMDVIKSVVLKIANRKPSEVTEDEAPLTIKRLNILKSHFNIVKYKHFNVLASASQLFKSKKLETFLLIADYLFIKFIPGFKILARTVIIELREPINRK